MRRALVALAVSVVVLAGCQGSNPIAGLASVVAPEPVPVLGGSLVVVAPAQYCPDPTSLQEAGGTAIILLGRCSAISTVPPAVLSVAIGAEGSGSVLAGAGAELAAYMASDAGRASISRSGKLGDARIRKAASQDGALFLLVEDRMVGTYWRGMASIAGRLVSITAIGPDLSPDKGRPLVEKTIRVLRRRNTAS